MNEQKIILKQIPVAQPRARVTKWGSYDPAHEHKAYAKLQASQQVKEIIEGPLEVDVTFYMPIPKSESKKRKALMLTNEFKHQKQKDLDNLLKYLFDVLNEVVFKDDKQVWSIQAKKLYSDDPRTEIILRW